jgi:hypothetical protein
MKPILRTLGNTALLLVFGLAAGCSRSPEAAAPSPANEAEAPAPVAPAPPAAATPGPSRGDALTAEQDAEPTTLADAEAMLEKARAELDKLALNDVRSQPPGAPAPAAAAPSPTPKPETRRAEKSSASQKAEAAAAKPANPCETACKAFSSLTRASDAVCRLDGGDGKRCERARRIHEDAAQRVASCGCAK